MRQLNLVPNLLAGYIMLLRILNERMGNHYEIKVTSSKIWASETALRVGEADIPMIKSHSS